MSTETMYDNLVYTIPELVYIPGKSTFHAGAGTVYANLVYTIPVPVEVKYGAKNRKFEAFCYAKAKCASHPVMGTFFW